MPLEFLYADPGGTDGEAASTSLGSNTVRFGEMGLSQSAEVGNPSVSSLDVDDPDAVWDFVGLRRFVVKETSAPSNNRIIWGGVVQDRTVKRADSMLTGAARHWTLELSDYNGQLGKRILIDADSKRPAETAGDRIRWLLTDAAHVWLFDFGHVTYPSDQMDPHDYRGMRPLDVLSDCAVESGYTFWCELHEATSRPELFFLDPGGSAYTSDIAISNVYADFDNTTTFLPSQDAELRRSASRVTYGAYVAYSKGAVYVRNEAVGTQFAKVDQTAPMATVKTAAKARRIGNHFLADNDEEDDRITCWIDVPAAQVNDIRAGHRTSAKFTHLPGYETYRYVRVAHRTVYQMEEGGGYANADNEEAYYRIRLEMSPAGAAAAACSTSLSGSVVATLSDQPYALGLVTLPITPTTTSLVIGIAGACNHNTPGSTAMGATGAYTDIFADTVPAGTPTFAMIYRANVPAGATTATAAYTGGFSAAANSKWGGILTAITTSATTPVQSKGTVSPDGSPAFVTLDSAPTPGNMLIMAIGDRSARPAGPQSDLLPATGWQLLGTAQTWDDGTSKDCGMWLYARCVQAGDGAGPYGAARGGQQFCAVAEWVIS